MTDTILNPNEAADLERARWFLRGLVHEGGATSGMAAALDKVADYHSAQVTASALLNGKEKEDTQK